MVFHVMSTFILLPFLTVVQYESRIRKKIIDWFMMIIFMYSEN